MSQSRRSPVAGVILLIVALVATSCTLIKPRPAGIGEEIDWSEVDGWEDDRHAQVWPALRNNCTAVAGKPAWREICAAMEQLQSDEINDDSAREFFETWFVPHRLHGEKGKSEGLITGYYEPLLFGSKTPDQRFRHPVYQQPDSLLTVDISSLYPSLENKRVRGMKAGKKIIPFYSRQQIESNRDLLAGNELLWLDDRDDVFFLHIQGSGRVELPDGTRVGVGYSNQNGHPYVPVGRVLLERGELERDEISLFTIRQWLDQNPSRAEALLNENPSYVFFVLRSDTENGPIGSLNVPLTPERSIAIDPKVVDLGTPVWLETRYPGEPERLFRQLLIAQDTGGAIRGPLRADVFWGHGQAAERAAGVMKERGSMVVLLPKSE